MEEKAYQMVNVEDYAMTVDSVLGQVALIQRVMETAMKSDEHYGVIPGTQKPTLLKPGAEKLCLLFRLNPDYDIIREIREEKRIAYTVKCTLTHIPTGQTIASGIGSCNSWETKYRYCTQNTGKPVPKDYWDNRDPSILGGPQFSARKKDKQWLIYEQIENENPWDLDNTIAKMACKRALVAAVLNATAASDIFTQDLEDLPKRVFQNDEKNGKEKQPDGRTKEGKKAKFEQTMEDLKKQIREKDGKEDAFFQCLGAHGFEKIDQITDREDQEKVYKDLQAYLKVKDEK